MKRSVRRFQVKARRFLKLYSLWHKTHREGLKVKWLRLLGEITKVKPDFDLEKEFRGAF